MKWLLVGWIIFVYGFFSWNIIPHFYSRYEPLIKEKLFSKPNSTSNFAKLSNQEKVLSETPSRQRSGTIHSQIENSEKETLAPKPQSQNKIAVNPGRWNQPLNNLMLVTLFLLIISLAYAWGKKILRKLKIEMSENESVISVALGLGVLSFATFTIGCFGLFKKIWFLLFIILSGILPLKDLRDFFLVLPSKFMLRLHALNHSKLRFVSLLILLILSVLFLKTFVPDQFYDTLSYHLALPQTYLNYGRLFGVPFNLHASFPQMAEMLFTLGLGVGGNDTLPLLFQFSFGVLILIFLLKKESPFSGLAALIWLTCPIIVENITFCKSDIFLSLFVTIAFYLIASWEKEKSLSAIVLAGIFSGFALGTKYTAVFFVMLFFILIFYKTRGLNSPARAKALALFSLVSFILFLPWLIKNLITFGNPLYPFLQKFFGYQYMHAENWQRFVSENKAFWSSGWNWNYIFLNLWKQTFYGVQFPSMNFIGPIWLAFLPVLFFYGLKTQSARLPFIFSAVIYIVGTTQTTLARYFFLPVLPILSLATLESVEQIKEVGFKKILICLLVMGVMIQGIGSLPTLERVSYGRYALFGLSDSRISQLYSPGYYETVQWVNSNLPPNSKILFIGETKSHLFQRKVIAPSVHNEHFLSAQIQGCDSGDNLYNKLTDAGITHILLNRPELLRIKGYPMFYWKEADEKILNDLWKSHLEEEYSNETMTIYEMVKETKTGVALPSEMESLFR